MLDRIWALMHIGIEIIFVFDGKGRPDVKGGKKTEDPAGRKVREEDTEFFKQTLSSIHVPWRQAPGEAEAECATLQRLGLVDAVWSEDGDTFMFGCTVVVRNLLKSNGTKSKEEARVFRLSDVEQKTGISRKGLVLYAMVAGCDYTRGLYGCSTAVGRELATKQRLVDEFSVTSVNADATRWKLWRRRLEAQLENLEPALRARFDKEKSNIERFPELRALRYCRSPKVSSDNELRNLDCIRGEWYKRYSTESLRTTIPYMRDRFHYSKPSRWWFRHLAPVALNQRALGKEPGARDLVREIKQKRKPKPTSTVEIDPRRLFPGIDQAICPQGMLVLNGVLTGKDADHAVVGKPIEMVQSEMLDAVLGWGMSDEEFLQWRKEPQKKSARNGKPALKENPLLNNEKEGRGRKRKAETSIRKPPTILNLPRKSGGDDFWDLDCPSSQELGSCPVPSDFGAASKTPSAADKSAQFKPADRVVEEPVGCSAPRSARRLLVPRNTKQTQEQKDASEVVRTFRKHCSTVNSTRDSFTRSVGREPVLSPLANPAVLEGKGGSVNDPIDLDD
ncbi:hypothetical protein CKAH01_03748 [Colletotrichum kahawae]|uniref:XPG-I domain-containing protein n=1 Tax=Colletotrichum kahawae TaxID=34407 RepID=A0AAD9YN76_COLKA|nr:hypothetical protein CKAH01_03748 [Colletotrichum kahawae]